jgi:hypothetical protein
MLPIEVGILVGGDHLLAWQSAGVRALLRLPNVRLTTVILHRDAPARERCVTRGAARILQWYCRRDDGKRALSQVRDPLAREPLDAIVRDRPECTGITLVPDEAALSDAVAAASLDLLLDLTDAPPVRTLSDLPRLGLWRHDCQDLQVPVAPPFGFWEVAEDEPTIATALYRVGSTPHADVTLYRSVGATNRFSIRKTVDDQLWKASAFAARVVQRVRETPRQLVAEPYARPARPPQLSAVGALAFLGRLLVRRVANRVRGLLFMQQWLIAYRFTGATDTNGTGEAADAAEAADAVAAVVRGGAPGFRVLMPPKDRIWADPFPFLHLGKHYLFFEEVEGHDGKGRIVVSELLDDGACSEPRVVLERPYHLSYPFVFEWDGAIWMIPESGANRTVELYRAIAFPFSWTLDRVLLNDVAACDATLFHTNGRWWMAVTIAPDPSHAYWDELHLYHAATPLGPWAPHAANPVRSDVRDARPAGSIVATAEGLLRPAQDCSHGYGYAIVLHRIDELDDRTFVEREVGTLLPGWHPGLKGTHTVNAAGRLVAIDGRVQRSRYW